MRGQCEAAFNAFRGGTKMRELGWQFCVHEASLKKLPKLSVIGNGGKIGSRTPWLKNGKELS
jgi:hypothetical protein